VVQSQRRPSESKRQCLEWRVDEGAQAFGRTAWRPGKGQGELAVIGEDPKQWINAAEPDNPQANGGQNPGRLTVVCADEQRTAEGVCWYYATGACKKTYCSKEHRLMSDVERAKILAHFENKNLPTVDTTGGA
jgi:hypothetical protein